MDSNRAGKCNACNPWQLSSWKAEESMEVPIVYFPFHMFSNVFVLLEQIRD